MDEMLSKKAIVSPNIRLRHPDLLEVGDYSIIDDYCYFSTRVKVGRFCHISASVTILGGRDMSFEIDACSTLATGTRVLCRSDDYRSGIAAVIPSEFGRIKESQLVGDVKMGRFTATGANTVVMPNIIFPEGAVVGAMSFVPCGFELEPWSVYAGVPIRKIGARNKKTVLAEFERLQSALAEVV